jgi:hypothetical protein
LAKAKCVFIFHALKGVAIDLAQQFWLKPSYVFIFHAPKGVAIDWVRQLIGYGN